MGMIQPGYDRIELKPDSPRGLGGWMILVQLGLYVSIARLVSLIINYVIPAFQPEIWDVLTTPGSAAYDPLWKPALIFEAAANIFFLLGAVFLLVLMYRKKATFPRWMIFYYAGNLLVLIIDYVLMDNIQILKDMNEPNSTQEIARMLVSCIIWIPYMIRSRRVHNTFIN
ncbi:DUF2569 domain-containing protein [Paenibacillus donghaensis]|uniref:DUF2569 domain-containing protein n=1 Tax=Paenibacillus donghaensis TaxID=414771 RepID=A0A2Z2KP95_9BACL|nr:DUF2569 domain-containing protein [Paenibacillus donghaensis]ASA25503.1 hypothetical protein B9T62_35095 [Paenibacillus donghaensis]